MKSFLEFINEMKQTKRVGIDHLNKIKPLDFIKLVKYIKDEMNGKINDTVASTTIKVDGFGLRFGLSAEGDFFIESSNSGPQFKAGAFSEYTKNKKGEVDQISIAYDAVYDSLSKNKKLQAILKKNNTESGIKIIAECLYSPIGKKDNGKIKFVAINYDEAKLGKIATFVLIKAINGNGDPIKNVLPEIKKLSTPDYLFSDVKVKTEGVDLNIDINNILKFIEKYPDWEKIVLSRKHADRAMKAMIKDALVDYQNKMGKKIIGMIKDAKFGEEFEGIVVQLANGKSFKVIHHDFSSRKDQKHRPGK